MLHNVKEIGLTALQKVFTAHEPTDFPPDFSVFNYVQFVNLFRNWTILENKHSRFEWKQISVKVGD